jgi:hypothetical protein
VMYQMLTGRFPYTTTEGTPMLLAHLTMAPEPPSRHAEVPVDLEAVVLTCLIKNPEQRFADARELLEALLNCEDAGRFRPGSQVPVLRSNPLPQPDAQTVTASELPWNRAK